MRNGVQLKLTYRIMLTGCHMGLTGVHTPVKCNLVFTQSFKNRCVSKRVNDYKYLDSVTGPRNFFRNLFLGTSLFKLKYKYNGKTIKWVKVQWCTPTLSKMVGCQSCRRLVYFNRPPFWIGFSRKPWVYTILIILQYLEDEQLLN